MTWSRQGERTFWTDWGTAPRTVVVFGGSFDPPHRGHIELPLDAARAIGADWVLYMPAAQSPHKDRAPGASAEDRLGMLRAALRGRSHCSVSDLELHRVGAGPSYTVDTLRELRQAAPSSVTFRLLIGADQALALPRWREPGAIVELAEPLVMRRSHGASEVNLVDRLASLPAPVGAPASVWHRRVVNVPTVDVSSTQVRALLRHGTDPGARAALRKLVPSPVLQYIGARGLYRAVPGA
ncbi:MAG: nicotinate (nicotinamide) nucleotide adenylyltransferase [Phycisphaerales bacterium]|nr:nicotinate (nicotinamide) nucleotide adenylyltransferase [Phycisphaerales bacterium]